MGQFAIIILSSNSFSSSTTCMYLNFLALVAGMQNLTHWCRLSPQIEEVTDIMHVTLYVLQQLFWTWSAATTQGHTSPPSDSYNYRWGEKFTPHTAFLYNRCFFRPSCALGSMVECDFLQTHNCQYWTPSANGLSGRVDLSFFQRCYGGMLVYHPLSSSHCPTPSLRGWCYLTCSFLISHLYMSFTHV